jgi:hypothetical protein
MKMRHERADRDAARSAGASTRETETLLQSISKQLEGYARLHFSVVNLVFRSEASALDRDAPLSSLLVETAAVNQPFLDYCQWHRSNIEIVHGLHRINSKIHISVGDLLGKMLALHSRLCIHIHVALGTKETATTDSPSEGPRLCTLSLESEIAVGLKQYDYPSPLKFSHSIGNLVPQHEDDLELDHRSSANQSTFSQLAWVKLMLANLDSQSTIALDLLRKEELIRGLEEHQANVEAHIASQKVREEHPLAAVCTIKQSKCFHNLHSPPRVHANT